MVSAELNPAALFAVEVGECHVPSSGGHKRSGALRPFDDENRTVGEVVLPSDRENVVFAMQTVEVHMHKEGIRATMLLHEAERRRGNAPFYTERCGGEEPTGEDLALLRFAGERLRHRESSGMSEQQDIAALLDFLTEQEAER